MFIYYLFCFIHWIPYYSVLLTVLCAHFCRPARQLTARRGGGGAPWTVARAAVHGTVAGALPAGLCHPDEFSFCLIRNPSTGWFKIPQAVPLSPAVPFNVVLGLVKTPAGPRFARQCAVCRVPCVLSCAVCHVPCVVCYMPCLPRVVYRVSRVVCHGSCACVMCHMSRVACHVSRVMCRVSCVACYVSCVACRA